MVRAQPYADVKLGAKNLGTTPFSPLSLVEGEYLVVLTGDGKRAERKVSIEAGRESIVAVNMAKLEP